MSEFSTQPPLSPEQVERQRKQNRTNYYLRLPLSYVPFFQAMAQDYYHRGKIEAPSIGLLAKTSLITAGNAWNRMQVQLMNKEYQKKTQDQDPQNYQRRREFAQTSDNLASQSVATKRPPTFVVEKTKGQLQQNAVNLVNTSVKEWGYPTITPTFDTSSMYDNRRQQQPPHQSQPRTKNQSYYDEDYGALQ